MWALPAHRGAALEDARPRRAGRDEPRAVPLGPVPHAGEALTWVTGMRTMTTAGTSTSQTGMARHVYLVTESMRDEYFYSRDGELLVVPQEGRLRFCTELGVIDLEPQEVALIPRGLVYRVEVLEGPARGFVCENYGSRSSFPTAGPSAPTAWRTGATSDARGGLRGPRGALARGAEVVRAVPRDGDRAQPARRGGLARQLRALQVRPADLLPGGGGALRPSGPVDLHGAHRALGRGGGRPTSTSCCSATAGAWPRTPSARPGTTRTSCPSSWATSTASTTPSPRASSRAGLSLHNCMLPHGPRPAGLGGASRPS
jgi:hypothetical protein